MKEKHTLTWLGRLAHDLRGPMAPLQMAASMIAQPGLDETQKVELCTMVQRQVALLSQMVDELADWASLSEGRLLHCFEETDLEWMLINALDSLDPALRARVALDAGDPVTVNADASRLIQAFKSLVEARAGLETEEAVAIRFQAAGEGRIELQFGAATADSEVLESSMDVPAPEGKGLGLSLPIASAIIRAHSGHLQWKGEYGAKVLSLDLPQYRG